MQQAAVYINYTTSEHSTNAPSIPAARLPADIGADISTVGVGSSTSVVLPGARGVPWGSPFNDTLLLLPTDRTLELRLLIDATMMEVIWQGGRVVMTVPIPPLPPPSRPFMPGFDLPGGDIGAHTVNYTDPRVCQASCNAASECTAFWDTFHPASCRLIVAKSRSYASFCLPRAIGACLGVNQMYSPFFGAYFF